MAFKTPHKLMSSHTIRAEKRCALGASGNCSLFGFAAGADQLSVLHGLQINAVAGDVIQGEAGQALHIQLEEKRV